MNIPHFPQLTESVEFVINNFNTPRLQAALCSHAPNTVYFQTKSFTKNKFSEQTKVERKKNAFTKWII
jgi:hypothetical protein